MNIKYSPAITETKVVEIKPASYTVELNQTELDILTTVVGSVIQDGDDQSIRKITSDIYNKFVPHRTDKYNTYRYNGYRVSSNVRFIKEGT